MIKNELKGVTREWIESIVIAFVLAMIIRTFCIQAFKIPSGSMRMTLIEGDRLMVNKLGYGAKVPFTAKRFPGYKTWERGDIIVFVYPEDPKRDFIKRLIAFEGETVEIRTGDIYVNDALITQANIKNRYYYYGGKYGLEDQKIIVPDGHVYVLGDNSASSSDSRVWGFVPEENIIGKAAFIYWPPKRVGLLE